MLKPVRLRQEHWDEWTVGSGINHQIASDNLRSATPAQMGQFLNMPRYDGPAGWLTESLHPITCEVTGYGQAKPDKLVELGGKKEAKYLSPKGLEPQVIYLVHPDPEYWPNILSDPSKPVLVTEGVKKAAAALSIGLPAIALTGVWNGQHKDGPHKPQLIPSLQLLAQPGRPFVLAFDADHQTNKQVRNAMQSLGNLLIESDATVSVMTWPLTQGKGLDDLLVNQGPTITSDHYANPTQWREWLSLSVPKPQIFDPFTLTFETTPAITYEEDTFENAAISQIFGSGNWATKNDEVYFWTGSYWRVLLDSRVSQIMSWVASKAWYEGSKGNSGKLGATETKINSALKMLRKWLPKLPDTQPQIAFNNGQYDPLTRQLLPHSKADGITRYLNLDHSPDGPCPPLFHAFLTQSFGPDLIPIIRAWTATILNPSAPYGYCIHLLGPSGSGKGTLIDVWSNVVGPGCHTDLSEPALINTPHELYQALSGGTTLLTFEDVGGQLKKLDTFYKLVENGSVTTRKLHSSETYTSKWGVRIALGSTQPLAIENANAGWGRRTIVLPLQKSPDFTPDRRLKDKLKSETHQIILWALSMPDTERDRALSEAKQLKKIKEAIAATTINGNSVASFIDSCLTLTTDTRPYPGYKLYARYKVFCEDSKYPIKGRNKFYNDLRENLGPLLLEAQDIREGNTIKAYPLRVRQIAPTPGLFLGGSLNDTDNENPSDLELNQQNLGSGTLEALTNATS